MRGGCLSLEHTLLLRSAVSTGCTMSRNRFRPRRPSRIPPGVKAWKQKEAQQPRQGKNHAIALGTMQPALSRTQADSHARRTASVVGEEEARRQLLRNQHPGH